MKTSFLAILFLFLGFTNVSEAQYEDILYQQWCNQAYEATALEFSGENCVVTIYKTSQNYIIFQSWCNDLGSIENSRAVTYNMSGDEVENLYSLCDWVQSSFSTGNDRLIFHSLENTYPVSSARAGCTVEVETFKGVECILARVLSNNQVLNIVDSDVGVSTSFLNQVGNRARIGYVSSSGISYCQQGTAVKLTCSEVVGGGNDGGEPENCTEFEEYSIGSLIPQGSPNFTLFSGSSSQNAKITNTYSYSGNKCLQISNGSDIDFNISRTITENHVARVGWKMYIPQGKTGAIGLETNHPQNYAYVLEFSNEKVIVYTVTSGTKSQIATAFVGADRWVNVSFIFQPFEDEIEFWLDYNKVHKLTNYQSNKIEDLNFYGFNNQNTEYYVDDLCYSEVSSSAPCPAVYDPVCVNDDDGYGNGCNAFVLGGYTEDEYYRGSCQSTCAFFSYPDNNAVNVPTDVEFTWTYGEKPQNYILIIKNASTGVKLFEKIMYYGTNNYSYAGLQENTKYIAELYLHGGLGSHSECTSITFTTKSNATLASCPNITYPSQNAINIPSTVNLSWATSQSANGYRLKVGTQPNAENIVNNKDVGNVTNYLLTNLPAGTQICFSVSPYNSAGQTTGCSNYCFTTVMSSATYDSYDYDKVSLYPNPVKDVLYINNIENGRYSIFDATGKIVQEGYFDSGVVPVQYLNDGIFILQLKSENQIHSLKFLKF